MTKDEAFLSDITEAFNAAATKHQASVNVALAALSVLRAGVLQGLPPELARIVVESGHEYDRTLFAVDTTEVFTRREIVRA